MAEANNSDKKPTLFKKGWIYVLVIVFIALILLILNGGSNFWFGFMVLIGLIGIAVGAILFTYSIYSIFKAKLRRLSGTIILILLTLFVVGMIFTDKTNPYHSAEINNNETENNDLECADETSNVFDEEPDHVGINEPAVEQEYNSDTKQVAAPETSIDPIIESAVEPASQPEATQEPEPEPAYTFKFKHNGVTNELFGNRLNKAVTFHRFGGKWAVIKPTT